MHQASKKTDLLLASHGDYITWKTLNSEGTIVHSRWAESSKTFNNSTIQYRMDFEFGSFCSLSWPAKNIWKALHLEIRKGSYDVSKFRHTFPMGKPFKRKPLMCCLWWSRSSISLLVFVNYVSSCNNTWIHHTSSCLKASERASSVLRRPVSYTSWIKISSPNERHHRKYSLDKR